jgi:transposase
VNTEHVTKDSSRAALWRRVCVLEAARSKLTKQNRGLRYDIQVLKAKVKELTARLGLNSTNSSMPPSSDKPWRVRPRREPSGKPSGGQPGHKGTTRKPFERKDIDREVPVLPGRCEDCKSLLHAEDAVGDPVRHQVVDIPKVMAFVIEYLLHQIRCRGCGHITSATLPKGVPMGVVGVRLQAVLALLTGRCRISRREAREVVATLFGWKALVSLGTVATMEKRTSATLQRAYEDALLTIQSAPFVNCDETSWREARDKAWLWAAATPLLRVFHVDRNRDREAFRHLLFDFDGILGTDRFSVYRAHPKEKRQICWAHLLRNFRGLEEYGGDAKRLGVEGQKAVEAVFKWWYRFKAGEITRRGLRRGLAGIRARFRWLMGLHERNPVRQARAIAKDLVEYEESLWTFARVEGVEPTNNLAERTIRKAVLWRKGSFGSASPEGSRFVERMLTVTESLRAQGRNVLDFLEDSVRAGLNGQDGPSLVPARAA